MTDNSDLEIINRVLAGDVDSFSEIVSKYHNRIFRYVYWRVYNYDEAVDVTQDIFLMTFESLSSFRRESKFYTWMFSIMVNFCRNYRKRRERYRYVPLQGSGGQDNFELQIEDVRQNPEGDVINQDSLRIVDEELVQMPDNYRDVIIMRDIEGISYSEIARILGISLSNVKVRIHRGREMLKKRLFDRGLL